VDAYRGADGWAALGDPTRRAIVACLAERPRAVGELAAGLPVTRPAVSQHLSVLRKSGLVAERRDGTRRLYRANSAGLVGLKQFVDRFWDTGLDRLKQEAEAEASRRARS
jgi:DNA-binding transcriptional ArsR family regulator